MTTLRCLLHLLLLVAPPLHAQPAAPTVAPSASPATPTFDIFEFVVEGDTLLGAAAIERAVYEFLGPGRTVADAEGARRALEKAYQGAGFLSVSVQLPPQRVDGGSGEVRLLVVPAAVDKLRVTGATYHLPSQVREAVPSLAPGNVPNFNEMQQELTQLSRASADREITPLLAAGERPGTLAVELKVQDNLPLHGFAELNSKQSQNTRAGRLEASLSYDNVFQRGHSLGFNWFYSPQRPSEANIQTYSWHLPLGGTGDRLYVLLVNSDSNTPTALGGATISRGQTGRARWRDELPSREGLSHALTWGATLRNLRDRNVNVAGFDVETPPLKYSTFSVAYDLQLTGSEAGRSSSLQAELSVSPPGLNGRSVDCFGSPRDQFACKRAQAGPGFQVFSLTLTHREPLGRWSLLARLQGQFADTPLVPSEQVVYGGQDSVRGYYESEQSGDLGAALRVELATPGWAALPRLTLTGLAFVDAAALRRLYALPSEPDNVQLGSAGLGLRVTSNFGLSASLSWARILKDTARSEASGPPVPLTGADAGRSQRWDFTLRQSF